METLEDRVAEIEAEFELVGEWNDRYRLLVDWGIALKALPEAERTETWFVSGCSSPLWLKAELLHGVCSVGGFSPGVLPNALVALLVRLYDGLPADGLGPELNLSQRLDLGRHLTPTRELTFGRLQKLVAQALRSPVVVS